MNTKLFALTILGAGFGIFSPATAQAYNPGHINRLAATLQFQTAKMHREVHAHFRLTPIYKHLDRDVAEMESLARHVADVARTGGSVFHLRKDVDELDRLYHHVDGLIRTMAFKGSLDPHALSHFRGVMTDISRTLHHLRGDLNDAVVPFGGGGFGGGFGLRIPIGDHGGLSLRFPIR